MGIFQNFKKKREMKGDQSHHCDIFAQGCGRDGPEWALSGPDVRPRYSKLYKKPLKVRVSPQPHI